MRQGILKAFALRKLDYTVKSRQGFYALGCRFLMVGQCLPGWDWTLPLPAILLPLGLSNGNKKKKKSLQTVHTIRKQKFQENPYKIDN